MDQLIFASLSHTHYWDEVGMLKVPAVVQLVTSKPSDGWTCVRISVSLHELGFFLTKKIEKNRIKKYPTSGERLNRQYTNIRLHGRRGKGKAESFSRENKGKHRRRNVDEKSCVTFLLCDPSWYAQKPDVQKKWDDNTHTHTHNTRCPGLK